MLYQRDRGAIYTKGKTIFTFYLIATNNPSAYKNPFRPILHYYWTHFESQKAKEITVSTDRFMQYAEYTYRWVLENWADSDMVCHERQPNSAWDKMSVTVTINYVLSPINLISNFISVLGLLDELTLVPLMITLSLKFIPSVVMQAYRANDNG